MNIKFDKVYCVSYCRNIEKQNNIRKIMNYLEIDFKFIYGADYSNLNILKHPDFILLGGPTQKDKELNFKNYTHFLGSSYNHYTAVIHAYESGANSVLIMEDDCEFINDIQYIYYHLNKYPKDADIVKFGYYDPNDINININKSNYIYDDLAGCQMYGICNRKTMEHYIEYQKTNFICCDLVFGALYTNYKSKNYSLTKPLAFDSFSLNKSLFKYKDKYNLLNKLNN